MKTTMLPALLCSTLLFIAASGVLARPNALLQDKVQSVTFLISINNTEEACIYTTKSPPIRPNAPRNKSLEFSVGNCDHGPLIYTVTSEPVKSVDEYGNKIADTYILLTWYSSVIEDASPPSCRILWNYNYKAPNREGSMESLLPGCYVEDSREGAHMTYYWFYIFDWSIS